jgi:NAD(P)-dependent dehydrogenase (short-subunit alcohol dehydrogenase family)
VGSVGNSLAGRTALVTGGSRGIGLGIAQSLVDRGARVVLTARKPEALAEAVETLGGAEVAVARSPATPATPSTARPPSAPPSRRSAASTCWSATWASTRCTGR